MNWIRVFIILLIFCPSVAYSIDPVFSQYYINSMHLNPAVAGSANDPRIFMHYRNQWPGLSTDKIFVTYQASYDQYVKNLNGGIGVNVVRDNILANILTRTNLDLIYSYRFKATQKLTMQAGLQASLIFFNKNLMSFRDVDTDADIDPNLPADQGTQQPDFSMGLLGMTPKSQIGLSIQHLNNNYLRFNSYFDITPLKISLFYARKFKIYNKDDIKQKGFYVTPAILAQKQSSSIMLNYGMGLRIENVLAGVWIRTNLPLQFSAAIFSIGYAFNNITIGYSYDYNMLSINKLMPAVGAHEITMVAVFPLDPKRGRYGPIKCPSAFVQ